MRKFEILEDKKTYFIKIKDSITERQRDWNLDGEMDFLLDHRIVRAFKDDDDDYVIEAPKGSSQEYFYLGIEEIDILGESYE